jgi:bifunctional non-homologous end joining protein LigD
MPKAKQHLTIDGRIVPVSNLDKILFPDGRITKAQVIDYYLRISDYLLPHLKNRPVTLKRYPNGALGEFFYEKDAPSFTPAWVETFPVPRRESEGTIRYILVNDRATLGWLANLANLEIHPFLHRVPNIDRPTTIVFDLDPGQGADVLTCARVAFLLRDLLEDFGLRSFVKVSGSKGLQIYAPLNTEVTHGLTQPFAKATAELLSQRHPKLVIADMAKALRKGKVFIDWSQNSDFKTTVGVYSLRAKTARPFVSLPVTWKELETAVEKADAANLYFVIDIALDRATKLGDLFKPILSLKQKLPSAVLKHLSAKTPRTLTSYASKRDFAKTKEPAPVPRRRSQQGSRRRFVIQKHAASHLHYDFRLEMHDVLKSWAVPKGAPCKEGEKRLAMPTEDHPLDYLEFEGIIPKGQYGGGTVMVWDIGTYELLNGNYYKGYVHVHLNGQKLKGEWSLVRGQRNGARDKWYLLKVGASMRAISKKRDDTSALSKRSMQQIERAADATWQNNHAHTLELDTS